MEVYWGRLGGYMRAFAQRFKFSAFKVIFGESLKGMLALTFMCFLCVPRVGLCQTKIVVSEPRQQFSIAIPDPCLASGSANPRDVSHTLIKDLDISGLFSVVSPNSYVDRSACLNEVVEYRDWRLINSEWLVKSAIEVQGSEVEVNFFLHDVAAGRRVLGRKYRGSQADLKKMAHRFANAIVKHITGEEGVFGTKIAFSAEVGRFKELFVMDMDGSEPRQLTRERGLALAPVWNNSGDRLLYTSYKTRVPDLYVMDFPLGTSRGLTRSATLEIGGDFSPDGRFIITGLSGQGRDSDLAVFDRRGRVVKRFGEGNRSIDISPTLSPDGERVAFCSDRGGSPQIYVMELNSGQARRVSYVDSTYCTSPDWSPRGNRLAYVCRRSGRFQMFTSNVDGSQAVQLTDSGDNEDPSWSPDGRYLAFASTFGRARGFDIAIMRVGDSNLAGPVRQLTFQPGDETQPAWGPLG